MNPLCIAVLDRDTLADRPFDFDFPHTLSSYGSTEAHQTAERIQGADIIITAGRCPRRPARAAL